MILKNSKKSKLAQVKPYFLTLFKPFYFQTESLLFPHVNGRYPLIQNCSYMSCCGMVASPGFHSQTRELKKDGRLHYKFSLLNHAVTPVCACSFYE